MADIPRIADVAGEEAFVARLVRASGLDEGEVHVVIAAIAEQGYCLAPVSVALRDPSAEGQGERPFCPACDLDVNACTCELGPSGAGAREQLTEEEAWALTHGRSDPRLSNDEWDKLTGSAWDKLRSLASGARREGGSR